MAGKSTCTKLTAAGFWRPVICSGFSGYRAPCTVIFEAVSDVAQIIGVSLLAEALG